MISGWDPKAVGGEKFVDFSHMILTDRATWDNHKFPGRDEAPSVSLLGR